jgi:hypothetical protein
LALQDLAIMNVFFWAHSVLAKVSILTLVCEGLRRHPKGGDRSLIKFFHKNLTYVPYSKPQAKTPEIKF